MRMALAWLGASLAACSMSAADAQPVYRCGNEYRDAPCENGRLVDAGDSRNAAQRAEARDAVVRDKQLAAEMQRDRRLQQGLVRPAAAASLSGAAPPAAATVPPARQPARKKRYRSIAPPDDNDFIAVIPGSGRKAAKALQR